MMAWYGLAVVVLVSIILVRAPHFSYSLDDPYIHLAVAQNIAHGNYGINAGETVSPSSSVVWAFLLAPFSRIPGIAEWIPLFYNVLFSLGTCVVVGRFLGERLRRNGLGRLGTVLLAGALVMAANLAGLTLTGMEHSLQVFLTAMCAVAVFTAYEGGVITMPFLIAAALAPAVRYEDVVFTGAVCGALWLQKRRGTAIAVFTLSVLPLVALGLFLHSHGLPVVPNSVLAKSGLASSPESVAAPNPIAGLLAKQKSNIIQMAKRKGRIPMLVSLLVVAVYVWRNPRPASRGILIVALAAATVMVLVGPYGWFYRYDIAIRVFLLLIALALLLDSAAEHGRSMRLGVACALSLWGAVVLIPAILYTPLAAMEIARQQYQMHRFVADFMHGNVAVNDIGWMSMDTYGKNYVLDVYGLANNEALRTPHKDAAWLNKVTTQHDIVLVMVYAKWFPDLPPGWQQIGALRQKLRYKDAIGGDSVAFYATSAVAADHLRPELEQFRKTLPDGAWLTTR